MIAEKMHLNDAKPFVIKVFCADGNPNGLRIINKSNWSGQGLVCPRSLIPNYVKDYVKENPEYKFDKPGVYVLVGHSDENIEEDIDEDTDEDFVEEDSPKIYIGEADPVCDRLLAHCSGDKDFWTWCISFVGGDLNKAHIQYLEASLIKLAKKVKKAEINNENNATFPNLSLSDRAIAEGFLAEMLSIFPLVGLNAFQREDPEKLLYIDTNSGIHAEGYVEHDGFVVLKGSSASLQGASKSINKLKNRLNKDGILLADKDHYEFVEDYTFHTPARAASVILGNRASRRMWKDKNRIAMGDLQKKEIGEKDSKSNEAQVISIPQ